MDLIHDIAGQSQLPVVTSFLLGLVVTLHPCLLATNLAALGLIARNAVDSRRLYANGLFYTLGRMLAYTLLGMALCLLWRGSASMLAWGEQIGEWSERLLGPMLLLFGVCLLVSLRFHHHAHCPHVVAVGHRFQGTWGSLLLGVTLALTFCPESAVVYFGILMPMTSQTPVGLLLPSVFSLGTSLPTLLLVWLLSCRLSKEDDVASRLQKIQKTANQKTSHLLCAVLFILAGAVCLLF